MILTLCAFQTLLIGVQLEALALKHKGDIMDNMPGQTNNTAPKGYGKRPMWQWVLLYIFIAVIVYGLIYLIFLRGGSGY